MISLGALPNLEIVFFVGLGDRGKGTGDDITVFRIVVLSIIVALFDGLAGLVLAVLGGALGRSLAVWGERTSRELQGGNGENGATEEVE